MKRKHWELTLIFILLVILFATFLAIPAIRLLVKSFWGETGLTTEFYTSVLTAPQFGTALRNSFAVSAASALLAVGIAFVMAYLIHYPIAPRLSAGDAGGGDTAHVPSHHYLRLRHHLLLWQAGPDHSPVGPPDL